MSRNWLRKCSIEVNGKRFDLDERIRVRFETISHTQQELSSAQIVLTNVSQATAAPFQQENAKISLLCGYEDRVASIFSGDITEVQWGERENSFTDKLLRVWARDGDTAYNQAKVSQTLAAGSTPKDILDVSLKSMQPFGITLGQIIGVDLSQPKFPRGFPLVGMTRDTMRELATNFGATWNVNRGRLNVIARGAAVPGSSIKLNGRTGMLNQPIVTLQGIIVSCLINPAIDVDTLVEIDSKSIVQNQITNAGVDISGSDADRQYQLASLGATDGTYRVLHVRSEGDTRGGPWLMELTCIGAKTGALNATQIGLGYS